MIKVQAPEYTDYRLTIPAREALLAAGNAVRPGGALGRWDVSLHAPPKGIVEVLIGQGNDQHRGLRMDYEPEFPGEWPPDAVAWHEQGQWTACPCCQSALVWYEAGYVPGYRICLHGHHVQLSADGRTAEYCRRQTAVR